MEKILKLMREYAESHDIKHGVNLTLFDDGSGQISGWSSRKIIFNFNSLPELIEKLNS